MQSVFGLCVRKIWARFWEEGGHHTFQSHRRSSSEQRHLNNIMYTSVWSWEPGIWSKEPGIWSWEPGIWSWKPGIHISCHVLSGSCMRSRRQPELIKTFQTQDWPRSPSQSTRYRTVAAYQYIRLTENIKHLHLRELTLAGTGTGTGTLSIVIGHGHRTWNTSTMQKDVQ